MESCKDCGAYVRAHFLRSGVCTACRLGPSSIVESVGRYPNNPEITTNTPLNPDAIEAMGLVTNPNMRPYVRTGGVLNGMVGADVYEVSKDARSQAIETLLRYMSTAGGVRVRIEYKDGSVECGYVGRSTGRLKLLILRHNSRSIGGAAILTGFIRSIRPSSKAATHGLNVRMPVYQAD